MRPETRHNVVGAKRMFLLIALFTLADLGSLWLSQQYAEGALESRFFRIGRERGLGEIIQYVKQVWILVMTTRLYRMAHAPAGRAWIVLFSVMLADDLIGIHEELGIVLHSNQAMGEALAMMLLEGSALVAVVVFASRDELWRPLTIRFVIALVPLVGFGLVLDSVTTAPMIEEAGEMLAMTVLFGTVYGSVRRRYSQWHDASASRS